MAILAAQAAAVSGDTIEVLADADITTDDSIGKDGVRYLFGPVVITKTTGTAALIGDGGANKIFTVQGDGAFVTTATCSPIKITGTGTNFTLTGRYCHSQSTGSDIAAIQVTGGTTKITLSEHSTSANYDAYWSGIGNHEIHVPLLYGDDNGVECTTLVAAGSTRVYASRIVSATDDALQILLGGNYACYIQADSIEAALLSVNSQCSGSARTVINCPRLTGGVSAANTRIIGATIDSTATSVPTVNSTGTGNVLEDCHLLAAGGQNAISGSATTIYGTLATTATITATLTYSSKTGDSDKLAGTTPTAAGLAVLSGANAAAQRTSLGVGTSDSPTFAGVTSTGTATGNKFVASATYVATEAQFYNSNYGSGHGIQIDAANDVNMVQATTVVGAFSTIYGLRLHGSYPLGFVNGTANSNAADVTLYRDAANVLALRNSTNKQNLHVYGTYSDATNYSLLRLGVSTGNISEVVTDSNGTGTTVDLRVGTEEASGRLIIKSGGTDRWVFDASGHLTSQSNGGYDIGTASGRVRTGYFGTSLDVSNGVITASTPALNIIQTWNNAGAQFFGQLVDITDTASAGNSRLAEWRVGGVQKAFIAKTGEISGSQVTCTNIYNYGWNLVGGNTYLYADAANTLALRNTTSAQEFRIYNTYTDTSNSERLRQKWSSNVIYIGPEALGTGVKRCMVFDGGAEKALTESANTTFCNVTCPGSTVVGGLLHYTIEANDGSDYQCRSGSIPFALQRAGGAVAGAFGTAADAVVTSNGTLTVTWNISGSGSTASLQANAVSSLTQTTLVIKYRVQIVGPATTVTPQ